MVRFISTLVLLSAIVSVRMESTVPSVHVLVYETENNNDDWSPAQRLANQINSLENNAKVTVFGQGKKFDGFGSKFSAVLPVLLDIQASSNDGGDSIVVISDSRDVLINNPFQGTSSKQAVDEFLMAYEELTMFYPSAIVVSAEAQCCVSALTHVSPGGYFNMDGSRKSRACSSGAEGCLWAGDDKAEPWESYMKDLQMKRTSGLEQLDDAYLNAGLMTGRVKNLIRVIQAANIGVEEDDQAVFTDYMYHNPSDIILDYQQKVFGNNRGGLAGAEDGGCVFEKQPGSDRLVHIKTSASPLFLHSPGKFFSCHDKMSVELGLPQVGSNARSKFLRSSTSASRKLQCNYGRLVDGILVGCEPTAAPVVTPVAVPVATPIATVPTTPSLASRLSGETPAPVPTSTLLGRLSGETAAPVPTSLSGLLSDRFPSTLAPVAAPSTSLTGLLASRQNLVPTAAPVVVTSWTAAPVATVALTAAPVATAAITAAPVEASSRFADALSSSSNEAAITAPVAAPTVPVPTTSSDLFTFLGDREVSTDVTTPVAAPTDSSLFAALGNRDV